MLVTIWSTRDVVAKYIVIEDLCCVLCGMAMETHEDLFFCCSFAKSVLSKVLESVGLEARVWSLQGWIESFGQARHQSSKVLQMCAAAVSCTIYCLWQMCNESMFAARSPSIDFCVFKVHDMLRSRRKYIGIERSRKTGYTGVKSMPLWLCNFSYSYEWKVLTVFIQKYCFNL